MPELDTLVDALIPLVLDDRRIWVLWVEGDQIEDVRRPFRELDLRMAAMDPDFEPLVRDHASLLSRVARVDTHRDEDIDFEGKRCTLVLSTGATVQLTLERMSLLGKRGRAHVAPIVDKTGRFRQVLSTTGVRS